MLRVIFLYAILSGWLPCIVKAQFISATLGINGLTCSMCSYAVQAELERLPFVDSTKLDLNTNIAKVYFKAHQKVTMRDVMEAVYKAGFSVGYTEATFVFDQLVIADQSTFSYDGETFQFLKPSISLLNGPTTIKFIDKKFIGKKGYLFWSSLIKESTKQKPDPSSSIFYHVTL